MRIGIVFNNYHPYTTGFNILSACKKLKLDYQYFHPNEQKSECDLYIHIDSGHEDLIDTPYNKTIFYAIDSYQLGMGLHLKGENVRFEWWNYVKDRAILIFDAFNFGKEWFNSVGKESKLIEMGIDEDVYFYEPMDVKYDVCFVGSRRTGTLRDEILKIVETNFNLYYPKTHGHGLRKAACESKCFLDIPPLEDNMLGQRFFEGFGCKVPMVSMDRAVLNPYTENIYRYKTNNLKSSLLDSINNAISGKKAPIERNIDSMKWTTKLSVMLTDFLEMS